MRAAALLLLPALAVVPCHVDATSADWPAGVTAVLGITDPHVVAPVIAPVVVGPPWISIEYPVNPYDETTKSAFLVVHAFHHGTPMDFPVGGTAEGLVGGERKSVKLNFRKTSRAGVFALDKQWPNDGTWTLLVHVAQGPEDRVYAVVDLARTGDVAAVRVPTRMQNGWAIPAKVAISDIDASLRTRAAQLADRR